MCCGDFIKSTKYEVRDKQAWDAQHLNSMRNPPDGKYIVRNGVECLHYRKKPYDGGPHVITRERKSKYLDPPPNFKSPNWKGGANPLRQESPKGTVYWENEPW
ncbi:hypothetical protein FBEOM_1953 [Fusarium beomiforme]|uniref:Uncharacterized protein n=1 Tax=Fusarium beomiforme TaxID=44412 RepID=A0A9P5E0L0_9HYPO|nr:hypothetical protein FBEOM_1953 [Fusarium beomiforme]